MTTSPTPPVDPSRDDDTNDAASLRPDAAAQLITTVEPANAVETPTGEPAVPVAAPPLPETSATSRRAPPDDMAAGVATGDASGNAPAPTATRRRAGRGVSRAMLRRGAATLLMVIGIILLFVAIRAPDMGLAQPGGQSWTQVITGSLGTALTAIGLALVVQPFRTLPSDG